MYMCCSVLQCVAVCCSLLQSVAVCSTKAVIFFCALMNIYIHIHILQSPPISGAAIFVLHDGCHSFWHTYEYIYIYIYIYVAITDVMTVCCSVLQCVAVCCGVLQCATVCCSVLQWPKS